MKQGGTPKTSRGAEGFWNRVSERYDASVMRTYAKTYRDTIALTLGYLDRQSRVLDFGCGTGIVTIEMAPHVERITAIDISEMMMAKAKAKAAEAGITNIDYRVTGLDDPALDRAGFDVVTAFNVLYFIRDLRGTLRRINALLPDGGLFLSATDCAGELPFLKRAVAHALVALGKVPYASFLTPEGLERHVTDAGFTILRTENLFENPPNYFIAARK